MKFFLALTLLATTLSGQALACGDFAIAGSSTVLPIAEAWAAAYVETECPGDMITVEGGGSSAGAARVCANEEKGTPVEIGDMSREWKDTEAVASAEAAHIYECVAGDPTRSAIQIDVAIDGLSVAAATGGPGATCLEAIGGLTTDQLRWIFSNYTDAQLTASGWDPASLPNSDGESSTHLWSELSADCPAVEIKIAGSDEESGTYEYFLETILTDFDNGETFGVSRPDGYYNSAVDEDLVMYIEDNTDAIGYFGYSYYDKEKDLLTASAVQNAAGDFVLPTSATVADGTYNPLARRIYMNLLNDPTALAITTPFIEFGFSEAGSALVAGTGYVPIPAAEMEEMLSWI